MKAKQILSLILCVLMVSSLLVGCGGKPASNDSGSIPTETDPKATLPAGSNARTITFWHCMGGAIGESVEEVVTKFNDSQSEIFVVSEFQGKYDDSLTKLKAAMPVGNAPDVVQMFELGTRYLVDCGYTIPAQDMLEKDAFFKMEDIEPILVNYYTVNGKFQCIPFNPSTPIMYYNKNAFTEAGLDPEKPPRSFEEIEAMGEKLIKKDGNRVTQYPFSMFIYGWFFENFIGGMGKLYSNNNNGRTDIATAVEFDTNGSAKVIMETWKRLVDKGIIINYGRKSEDAKNAFISGQAAMLLESTAQLSTILNGVGGKFEVGTAYLPMMDAAADGGVIIGGGNLWMMNNKDEQRIKDAWEFIKFATSPEVAAAFSRSTGYFCANKNAYETPEMKEYLEKNPNFQTAINQLHDTPLNYATQGASLGVFSEIRSIFEQNMEMVLQNGMSIEQCIESTAKTANDAIANYNKTVK